MEQLAEKYRVSENTVSKWKSREYFYDRSSRPHTIYYSLSDIEQEDVKNYLFVAIDRATRLIFYHV